MHNSIYSLEACNNTELYQICRRLGFPVTPQTPRAQRIAWIMAEEEPKTKEMNEIDLWRDGLMRFLLDCWTTVEAQLTCPAKSGDPKACYQCVDAQVMFCIVDNEHVENLIQLRRKP